MIEIEVPTRTWQGLPVDSLGTRWSASAVHAFTRVGSTNDVARRLAERGAPSGTVVVSDEQVLGRGRVGRGWVSAPGLGLWMSAVYRASDGASPALLPLLVGVAAARAIDSAGGPRVGIKWPNDLLIDGRKIGGVLCEAVWIGDAPAFTIVGVGINVLHGIGDFPPEIGSAATSLWLAGSDGISLLHVADRVIPAVLAILARPSYQAVPPDVVAELASRDDLLGVRLVATDPVSAREIARGTGRGISLDGSLKLETQSGDILSLRSGTVRVLDDHQTRR